MTVLSRCQRFDLKRIPAPLMVEHLTRICGLEGVSATEESLAMIARAGEGSVRDCLSLLDQAIAHGSGADGAAVDAARVRDMLGLADRARRDRPFRSRDEGDIGAALAELQAQYDARRRPGRGGQPTSRSSSTP